VPNFHSLLYNIALNNVAGIVSPISAALHDREGVFPFNYHNWVAGSSMSQLGGTVDGEEVEFRPVIAELKVAVTLDRLVADGAVRPPDHVKIDVDGNELQVLRGMTKVLTGPHRPRSLQVEINARHRAELFAFLGDCGFEVYHRHYTQLGAKAVAAGKDPEEVAHNALFRPRAAAVRAA
jgi:FkbM family methyltransferase